MADSPTPAGPGARARPRVLLDTNVWRYMVDAEAVEELRRTAQRSGVEIVAAPAVLYECLRTSDAGLRHRLVKAVTRGAWTRPLPEVFSECAAVVAEIRRLRPHWMKRAPDMKSFIKARSDWTGRGIWHRARTDPGEAARVLSVAEGGVLDEARDELARMRRNMLDQDIKRLDLRAMRCHAGAEPGYDGGTTDCWRFQSRAVYTEALFGAGVETGVDPPHVDWIEPFVDLQAVRKDRAGWNAFWLRDASIQALPREWLRWALATVQSLRRPGPGTPVDNQIGGYLLDCDVAITADRIFADVLDTVRGAAPFRFGDVAIVAGSPRGVAAAFTHIASVESSSAPIRSH